MLVVERSGRIKFINTRTETMFGYSRVELTGELLERLLPERYRASHTGYVAQFFSDVSGSRSMGAGAELVGLRENGEEFPIEVALSPIEHGDTRMAIAAVRDISARRRAEEELRRNREEQQKAHHEATRAQAQLDCAPITVVRLDAKGCITHVNDAWHRFARENDGAAPTVVGVGLDYVKACRLVREDSAQAVADGLQDLLAGRRETLSTEYPCHAPTEVRWFRLDASRVASDAAVVLIHTNVTQQHLAEARLRVQMIVTAALVEHRPLLDTCHRVLQTTCEGLEWDFGAVWIPGDGDRLRCVDVWVRPGLAAAQLEAESRGSAFTRGRGLPGSVYQSRAPQWHPDIEALAVAPCIRRVDAARGAGLRSAFAIPLTYDGEVIAVLEFYSRIRREVDEKLLEMLATAGLQLGAHAFRVRAERETQAAMLETDKARAQLKTLLECAPASIIAIDRSGRIQFINRVVSLGRIEDAVGTDLMTFIAAPERPRVEASLKALFESGEPQAYEATATAKDDGRILHFSTRIAPMREGDAIVGAVLVSQDVTAAKQAGAELAGAQRLAAVGSLAAGVAHEINTPVQFVSDSLHFLRDAAGEVFGLVEKQQALQRLVEQIEPSPEMVSALAELSAATEAADLEYLRDNVPKAFDRCIDGLGRVATIVRSMKEFAHPAQKEMSPTDLNRAVQSTLTVASNEYKYVADLETELGELPLVNCHVNDINQVVLNILVNAAHAISDVVGGTERRGKIRVTTRLEGDTAVIAISDTGGGIPECVQARIFDPFFTTKDVGRGTGQGLAIARTIVKEKHGGDVTFETKLGVGTTFSIRLPIAGSVRPEVQT